MSSNVFKNKVSSSVGVADTTVYSAPSGKTATIIGLSVANKLTSTIFVSIKLNDTSSSTSVFLVKNAPVPVGGSLVVVGGDQKVILENGDSIVAVSDTASSADIIMSVMELDEVV